ncbi:MAG: DUF3179 domain-containing protein, partial [Methylothermaceae bacterium]|nr:DUF3179 domain-containing protein [Methylothermaceae bacterium]
GRRLDTLPLSYTTWAEWRARHPDTRVLSTDTGYRRDYERDPYASHARSKRVPFPLVHRDDRYHPKALILGVELNGETKAYPFKELAKTSGEIRDRVGGRSVIVRFDPKHRTARVFTSKGRKIPAIVAYWFGWYAFHPETAVFRLER